MTETKEVAMVDPNKFAIANMGDVNLHELVAENLGDEQLTPFDLTRITVPPVGATSWVIPTQEGDQEVKELNGIIIKSQKTRSHWKEDLTGEGTPPDCTSYDMIHGYGDPGGLCKDCPNNVFGTGQTGYSKACKETNHIFLLMEGSLMPVILQIPPTSLNNYKKYCANLIGKMKSINSTITTFTLQKNKSGKSGFQFNEVCMKDGATLSKELYESVKQYKKGIESILGEVEQVQ